MNTQTLHDKWVHRYVKLSGDYSVNADASIRILLEEYNTSLKEKIEEMKKPFADNLHIEDGEVVADAVNTNLNTATYNQALQDVIALLTENSE